MMDKDQYLREQAFKGGPYSTSERVLNAQIDDRKAFVWLVNRLHAKEILSVDDIDDMLFVARPLSAE